MIPSDRKLLGLLAIAVLCIAGIGVAIQIVMGSLFGKLVPFSAFDEVLAALGVQLVTALGIIISGIILVLWVLTLPSPKTGPYFWALAVIWAMLPVGIICDWINYLQYVGSIPDWLATLSEPVANKVILPWTILALTIGRQTSWLSTVQQVTGNVSISTSSGGAS